VQFDPENEAHIEKAIRWYNAMPRELQDLSVRFLNRLEAWSMYFTNQLADADIAFGPCAPFLCSRVVQLYAVLLVFRNRDPTAGKFPNLVALYKSWLEELDEQKRGLVMGDLLKVLESLQSKGRAAKLPSPLGTKLDE
jgi:hypothetical protein